MSLPRILLIATGGTIAGSASDATATTGYFAGSLSATALLEAVPELFTRAHFSLSQPFSLDSRDMGPGHWLQLAREVGLACANPAIDGVVITHGTDTLEETAFFLDRVLAPGKPVVMTCAMRPATAHSADGPLNLLQAVAVAGSAEAAGLGVLVVVNERIHAANGLAKRHTQAVEAFDRSGAVLGWANPLRFDLWPRAITRRPEMLDTLGNLPRVDVLWVGAGSDPNLLAAAVAHGARALVLALPGNGSIPAAWLSGVGMALAKGIPVVRASRVGEGCVTPDALDQPSLIPAGTLSPQQARVALMLALGGGLAPDYFFG